MRNARHGLVIALTVLGTVLGAVGAAAHEVRPGYLELREIADGAYDVLWKVPAKGERRLGIDARLPEACTNGQRTTRLVGGGHVERWRTTCAGGVLGGEIAIDGLAETRTDVLVRIEFAAGVVQTVRLTPDAPALTVALPAGPWAVAGTYVGLGVEHILGGIDHLLFVLALLFLVGSVGRLIATITAFTLAHSLTLGAATLGWVHVPAAPVEATIALSIVLVAVEILYRRAGRETLAGRRPWLLAFAFGLLHGFGFAGALSETGLPAHAVPIALACFNVGVELGQLAFVAVLVACAWLASRVARVAPTPWQLVDRAAAPAAYAIGVLATFWLLERTAAFW